MRMTIRMRLAQRTAGGFQIARRATLGLFLRHPLVSGVVLVGLLIGALLANNTSTLILIILTVGLVTLAVTSYQPAFTTAAFVALIWGNVGDVLIKFHHMPSIVKPLVALLALVVMWRRIKREPVPLVNDAANWWFLAYVLILWLGMTYAPFPNRVLAPAFDVAKDFVNYLVIINLLTIRSALVRAIWLSVIVGGIIGGLSVYQEITQTYQDNYGGFAQMKTAFIANGVSERARAAGPIQDPNGYAQLMIPLVLYGLWSAMHGRTWRGKLVGAVATAAIVGGVVLSFSRGGYVGLTVGLIAFAVFTRANWRVVALLSLLVAILFALAPPEFQSRFGTLSELFQSDAPQTEDTSLRGRSSYAEAAAAMFVDYPILGVGQANYQKLYPKYIIAIGGGVVAVERNSHSLYLQVLTEHGLLGATIFGGLMVTVWLRLKAAQRIFEAAGDIRMAQLAIALRAGFVGYMAAATFLHDAYPVYLWLQVSLAVALFIVAKRSTQSEQLPG